MRKKTILAITLVAFLGYVPSAVADLRWHLAKAYTASLADGAAAAADAVAAALENLQNAREYVDNARAAVDGVQVTLGAAGTTGAVGSALGNASAIVAAAEAGVAAAEAAAANAAALAAAAAAGTLIGQGANWLISLCWDPVCGIEWANTGAEATYSGAATDEEVQSLIPELVLLTTGQTVTIADFESAGDAGETSLQFLSEGIRLFLGLARGAAAVTAGNDDEGLSAITDLELELAAFPGTISDFAAVLESASLQSPLSDLQSARETYYGDEFQVSSSNAIAELTDPAQQTELTNAFATLADSLNSACTTASTGTYSPLITTGETIGLFADLTSTRFEQFVSDCGTEGADCLPPEEIAVVEALLAAANATIPTISNVGTSIAAFDADTSGSDASFTGLLADESVSTLSLSDVLSTSVTDPVTGELETSWMAVDLEDSPVTIAVREATGSSSASGCSLIPESHY